MLTWNEYRERERERDRIFFPDRRYESHCPLVADRMWEANVKAKHTRRNPLSLSLPRHCPLLPPRLSSPTSHPILFALRFSPTFFFNVVFVPLSFLFPVFLSSPLLFLLSLFLSRLCSSSEGKAEPAENNSLTKDPTGFVVTFLRAPPPSSPRFHKEFIRISA